jgi:hypothetical protein
MFIRNHQVLIEKFACRKAVANYLMTHGVPLLSREDDIYYFSETENMKQVMKDAPIWVKLFAL